VAPAIGSTDLVAWVRDEAAGLDRYLFGVAGAPGSGKSTLAERLGAELDAPVVAMDGFHLANAELAARGLRGVKGAPDTFDAQAFVDLVESLRDPSRTVSCPAFDRTIDEPVVDRIRVTPSDTVVIVEGNYLLLDQGPWSSLKGLLHATAYLEVPTSLRVGRLVARHIQFGRDRADAIDFANGSDAANALLVEASRFRADLYVVTEERG
jgi:pantothenate kinase